MGSSLQNKGAGRQQGAPTKGVEVPLAEGQSFAPRLIDSRLQPPLPLVELVRRDGLLRQLSATTAPLIAVSAPGGFGKTVTLAQWVRSNGCPFAWLQADEADNDPLVFLGYLAAALGRVADVDPLVANWLQLAPPPVETRILPALAVAVAAAPPFVLVVDDAHLIENEGCWQMLGLLFSQLPRRAHLCVSGRAAPPLPLGRLRVAGQLLELGPAELALSPRETCELLHLHGLHAGNQAVAYLEQVTEGWAAGLSLAALAGSRLATEEWLAGIRGHQHDIAGYLASEVLAQQPPEVAEFLLQTSILERLSSGLCRAVTDDENAGDLLHNVARNNLFVAALDNTDEWYRYHHLFAEFLQTELLQRDELQAAVLHGRAAAWFEDHSQLEEAVHHWLAAGEPHRAGNIVCRAHMDYTRLARYETLHRWLELFSDEQILADPALAIAAGWIGPMTGDSPRGRAWIRAAFRTQVGDSLWPGTRLPLRAMQAGLIAALAPEGVAQMLENAELAVSLSEEGPASERAAVDYELGVARWLGGDNEAALRILREAEDEGAVGNALAEISAIGIEASILADEARWDEARTRTAAGRQRLEETGLGWGVPVFPLLVAQTRVLAHDDATLPELIATVGSIVAQGNLPAFLGLHAESVLGELFLERDDLPEAARWIQNGLARLAHWPDAGILRERLLRLRQRLEGRQMLEPLTSTERRVLELLPTELSLKQIAARLFVSPNTVHSHVRDIYRKLEVHSRSEAVARARDLALVEHT